MHPNQSDQLKAVVNRHEVVLPLRSNPIHKKRFNIGVHLRQRVVIGRDRLPGRQRQQRLGRPGRAWIHRFHFFSRRTIKKEGEIDRESQAIPFGIRQLELRQRSDLSRYQLESAIGDILKPESARITGAGYPGIRRFQQVAMIRSEPHVAKLATLFDWCGPAETA